ncbi:sulfur carrier protein ThiS [bacterium]|nr:sulfur carrier protein ThiS [candidate division CSSED10-310 bacterium]
MITINNRDQLEWTPGMTVRDLLTAMNFTYVLIMITVNGELVDDDDYDTFKILDNASVRAIHIHHGG